MTDLRLPGCRTGALLDYLKGLGVLRLVAEQVDASARARWTDGSLHLRTLLDREALERYFLEAYAPTPIFNPWNGGAGFDEKSRKQTAGSVLNAIATTTHPRWAAARDVLAAERRLFADDKTLARSAETDETTGGTNAAAEKAVLLKRLRRILPDAALPWLDAAVAIGRDAPGFPPLLGTGGNDGRLDFSVNFNARALDVIGNRPMAEVRAALCDALDGTGTAPRRTDAAIGQFAPSIAGGPNATNGFDAGALVNPWDFVLMIEGAIVFTASVAKRLEADTTRPSYPFTFSSVVAGGFASAMRDEGMRGEIWLPVWDGWASFPSVRALFRAGRMDIDRPEHGARGASSPVEAIQAVKTLGVDKGVSRFERVAFLQRNGLAFSATHVGTVDVADDPVVVGLGRNAFQWLQRHRAKATGAAAGAALRALDDALFAYASGSAARTDRRASLLSDLLVAFARFDDALATTPPEGAYPLPYLPASLYDALENFTHEHRLAKALASLGGGRAESRMRLDVSSVVHDGRAITYAPRVDVPFLRDPGAGFAAILERRTRVLERQEWELTGSWPAELDDVTALLAGDEVVDGRRLARLVAAYARIEPAPAVPGRFDVPGAEMISAPYALLRMAIAHHVDADGADRPPEVDAASSLRRRRTKAALEIAYRRLRASGFMPRDVRRLTGSGDDAYRLAAAVLCPLADGPRTRLRLALRKAALVKLPVASAMPDPADLDASSLDAAS